MDQTTTGRFAWPTAGLSTEQIEVLHAVAQSRQGLVPRPFKMWSRTPDLARAMDALASYLLPKSTLTARETELAILVSAAHWECAYVWDGHARAATELGLSSTNVQAIRNGEDVRLDIDRERAIYDVSIALHSHHKLSTALFERAVATLDHAGIADLTALLGFYAAVAFTLIAYDVPGRPQL